MKLIVGLGNPGKKYELTRHNAGFLAIDHFLKDKSPIACQSKFQVEICELHFGSTKVYFVKPQTFMNNSGRAILDLVQFYKVDADKDVLVIHDEADLPLGTIRLADNSSAAGHNGVKSIFETLGTQNIHRIRIGVETRASRNDLPTDAFVLQNFTADELETLNKNMLPEVDRYIRSFVEG